MPNQATHSYTAAELAVLLKKQAADRIVKPHAHAAIHHWDTWESAVEGTLEWKAAEFLMRQVGPGDREKHMADLLRGWCDTLEVTTPADGLMAGKFCLFFTLGHGENKHRYGLAVAENSYDDAALNAIMGLLEHSAKAINSTPATTSPIEKEKPCS